MTTPATATTLYVLSDEMGAMEYEHCACKAHGCPLVGVSAETGAELPQACGMPLWDIPVPHPTLPDVWITVALTPEEAADPVMLARLTPLEQLTLQAGTASAIYVDTTGEAK